MHISSSLYTGRHFRSQLGCLLFLEALPDPPQAASAARSGLLQPPGLSRSGFAHSDCHCLGTGLSPPLDCEPRRTVITASHPALPNLGLGTGQGLGESGLVSTKLEGGLGPSGSSDEVGDTSSALSGPEVTYSKNRERDGMTLKEMRGLFA